MKTESTLGKIIKSKDFIVTAECAPGVTASPAKIEAALKAIGARPAAVALADNAHGVGLSSLAASAAALKLGIEPILQIVTRDRNRIAIQSDLLGAASLGIGNVLCMSGYHQTIMGCPESANVFDIDSTQLIGIVKSMSDKGTLLDGSANDGSFSMLAGAAANPNLKPLELGMLRLHNKIEAGAAFIITHTVFDIKSFAAFMEAAAKDGLTEKAAFLAGVYALESAEEAEKLRATYAEFVIPDEVIERLRKAGENAKKEGLAVCAETMKQLKGISGLRGIHIMSGGRETIVPSL